MKIDVDIMLGHNVKDPSELSEVKVSVIMDYIKSSEWMEDLVSQVRAETDKDKRRALKTAILPYITSGLFSGYRHSDNFIRSSLFIMDIDHVGDVDAMMARLKESAHTYFAFRSPSGDGVKVGIRLTDPITDPKRYSIGYRNCALKFQKFYGVETDKTVDSARACYLSYDPNIYYNPLSTPWLAKCEEEPKPVPPKQTYQRPLNTDDEYDRCLALAQTATVSDYADWVECGIALRNHWGPRGYDIFKALSLGKGFPDDEQAVWKKWESFPESAAVTLGTFVHLTKKHGGTLPQKT